MSQAEEEVDAFGRTVVRRFERTESRVREDDRPRERTRSPGRYDSSRYDDGPRGRRGGYGDDMYYGDYPRGRQQYQSDDLPRHNSRGYDDYYSSSHNNATANAGESFPARNSSGDIKPLMSFKNFVHSQPEDLPVDEFQRLYEQYTVEYMNYFSDSFFKQSKAEEWFQDRYNPIHIVDMEKDAAENGRVEAEKFKQSLLCSPEDFIAACSLEPSARRNRKSLIHKTTEPVTDGNEENADSKNKIASAEEMSGRHLSGHESRTVYLSGVHACCPKFVLSGAIITRLREAAETSSLTVEELTPERILISQPMWSHRVLDKFERSAWVVLPATAASANIKVAMDTLNNLEVVVPLKATASHTDAAAGATETATAAFTFKLQASLHMVSRNVNTMLPEYLSYSVRMKEDIKRATLLAKLLDEDREIPEDCRLGALLRQESLCEAVRHMHEHLDLIIAYLRRVHYIAFYGARRFRDEAHLLLMAPCVAHRSKPFFRCDANDNDADRYNLAELLASETTDGNGFEATVNELLDSSSSALTTAEEEAAIAAAEAETEKVASASKSTHEEEESEENKDTPANEEDDEVNSNRVDDSAVTLSNTNVPVLSSSTSVGVRVHGRYIVTADRKMENLIRDMKKRILAKRSKRENNDSATEVVVHVSSSSFADEDDAKKLQALQDITFEKYVHANSNIEQNEKCRCMYPGCGKLFQNAMFIVKHFRLKHPGCADTELLADAEPFMRRRFDEEELIQRPLPPVEMDINNRVDLKTVREVMENCQKYKTLAANASASREAHLRHRPHPFDRHSSSHNNHRQSYNNNNYRPRNSFGSSGGHHHHQNNNNYHNNKRNRDSFEQSQLPADGEGLKITASNDQANNTTNPVMPAARRYMDADAPKETASGAINYGSIIPGMAKRRKLSGKVTDPLLASPPPAVPKTEDN